MTDKLLIENYLLILKSTVEVFIHGTLESSHEDIRSTLKETLNEILTSQANTYNIMAKNNWYQVNNIKPNMIKQALNKVTEQ